MKRRTLLACGVLCGVPITSSGQPGPAVPQPGAPGGTASLARPARPGAAFGATTVPAALAALGAGTQSPGHGIRLEVPDIVTARGPVLVSVSAELSGVTQVAILVHGATFPLAALLRPDGATQPWTVTVDVDRLRTVTALVQADGAWYSVSREIKVAAKPW
jgi:predicted secreted protein